MKCPGIGEQTAPRDRPASAVTPRPTLPLDLAFLWFYYVLQFICVRCSLFCVIVHLCMCGLVVLDLVF